jgi:NAD(P)-dependent dehydrogenase (short-subunit alcohol dehydrogenase family)
MDLKLAGKVALVTGASVGLGRAIAEMLAGEGCRLAMVARREDRLAKAADEIAMLGHERPLVIAADITQRDAAERIRGEVLAAFGRLDILVNNAGIVAEDDGPPSSASLAAVRHIFDTNFFGLLAVTQAMLPLLRKAPAARIVNLSSALGSMAVNGDPSSPFYPSRLIGYNASKAAVNMLTVQLSEELRDTDILVNAVSPGFAQTDLTGGRGRVTAAEAAIAPVRYALLETQDAVTGGFVSVSGTIAW